MPERDRGARTLLDLSTDGHVHTSRCGHAVGEMADYVRVAVEKGLSRIIFLEHLEKGVSYWESTWLSDDDFERYHDEGARLRESYRGVIEIGMGVEVGFNPAARAEILALLGRFQWDRVGISYHYFAIDGCHYNVVSRRRENLDAFSRHGLDRVLDGYFAGLLAAVNELPGDVLCHLDAVLRHHPQVCFRDRHWAQIETLLDAMQKKGMALEVNTSGYRLRGEAFPAVALIRKAVGMGIPLAVGSDAHHPDEVGRFFHRLREDLGPAMGRS